MLGTISRGMADLIGLPSTYRQGSTTQYIGVENSAVRMTVTIDLEPELEARLRAEAARQGLDPGALVRSALEERLRAAGANGARPLTARESELLQNINLGLSQETWQRYHDLAGKRTAETL